MSSYAIMRTAKIKTLGNLSASIQHTFRERPTPNADPARTHLNQHFGAANGTDLGEKIAAAIPERRRKDAVLCIEHLFTASPEWWLAADQNQEREFFERSKAWLEKIYGSENVMYYGTQLDETSPHAVAYVVPLRDGKLNAKSWLGGAEKLRELQTGYAETMRGLGLERGIEGSTASHERVKRFYGALEIADTQSHDKGLEIVSQISVSDRLALIRGKVPESLSRALSGSADLAVQAKIVVDSYADRKAAQARQAALKEIPAREARIERDAETLRRRKNEIDAREKAHEARSLSYDAAWYQKFQAFESSLEASYGKKLNKLEAEKLEFANRVAELERTNFDRVFAILKDVGIHLAQRGPQYVGNILKIGRLYVMQQTSEFGMVVHEREKVRHEDILREGQIKSKPVTIRYNSAWQADLRLSINRDLERKRDFER